VKSLMLTIATLALLAGTATAQNPTQDHRMWAAEQMINRVTALAGRSTAACKNPDLLDFRPKLSEACLNAVASTYPILNIIRQIAANGDDDKWAKIIGVVQKLEAEIQAPLNALERR
jgi:hypothetical protein